MSMIGKNLVSLNGSRVLVTGASSGIGRATAKAFAAEGASVIATGRRLNELESMRDEAGATPRAPEIVAGDINDPAFARRLATTAGSVDILVNCAGMLKHAPFLESEEASWRAVFDTNVMALLRLTQFVARGMSERRKGHIVNISSVLADKVYPYTLVYAATKYAVRAISEGLRMELEPHGIRVTEIAPGLVQTAVLRDIDHPDVLKAYQSRTYKGLSPESIADAIVFAVAQDPHTATDLVKINPVGQY
jgi:NADP-dependent 3-hydroxy acid dehydrogenase YdfG